MKLRGIKKIFTNSAVCLTAAWLALAGCAFSACDRNYNEESISDKYDESSEENNAENSLPPDGSAQPDSPEDGGSSENEGKQERENPNVYEKPANPEEPGVPDRPVEPEGPSLPNLPAEPQNPAVPDSPDLNEQEPPQKSVLSDNPNGSYAIGKAFYNYEFDCYDGKKITMNELLNEYNCVLLNFYYTSCYYCNDEWAGLKSAYSNYSDKVAVICLNVMNEPAQVVLAHKSNYGLPFIMADGAVLKTYFAANSSPTSVVIDGEGIVRDRAVGERTRAWFESKFKQYS